MPAKDPNIIKLLNTILKNELTAINQYFLHARMLRYQGFEKLADKEYEESLDEMKHADQLIERILFLEGIPNLQDLGKLMIGESPEEMLACDLKLEEQALADLKKAASYAHDQEDYATESLVTEIIASEEEHQDWLRKQLDLIKKLGAENYLQTQV